GAGPSVNCFLRPEPSAGLTDLRAAARRLSRSPWACFPSSYRRFSTTSSRRLIHGRVLDCRGFAVVLQEGAVRFVSMAEVPGPSSETITETVPTAAPPPPPQQEGRSLTIKLRKRKTEKKVEWSSDTVDNEHLGRRSSKCCCVYEKPRQFGESSTESEGEDEEGCGSAHCILGHGRAHGQRGSGGATAPPGSGGSNPH
ncbi:hypothetical protein AOLI_G00302100, partial [Acnodon oligacanthus]